MLRFFRILRRKFLEEDNFRKYFWYAIGEILLVVVGILIALQINNWNEDRKKQAFISYSLSEMHLDLKTDLTLIYKGIEPRLKAKTQAAEDLFEFIANNEIPEVDHFRTQYNRIDNSFAFTPTFGTYNTLKEQGLQDLKNEELRIKIVYFYENRLPRTIRFIHGNEDFIDEQVAKLEPDFLELRPIFGEFSGADARLVPFPKGDDYFNHQSLYKVLNLYANDAFNKRNRMDSIKKDYFEILDAIELELEERSISFATFDSTAIIPDF